MFGLLVSAKMALYNPRCRPEGDVVVVSLHRLKRPFRSRMSIVVCCGLESCLHYWRTSWMEGLLGSC